MMRVVRVRSLTPETVSVVEFMSSRGAGYDARHA
jgi:hypothetical protein